MNAIKIIIPTILAMIGITAIVFWLTLGIESSLPAIVPMVPGMEGQPTNKIGQSSVAGIPTQNQPVPTFPNPSPLPSATSVAIGKIFTPGIQEPLTISNGRWTRFRGEEYTNINTEKTVLASQWPESGPPILWKLPLGEGHAGVAVWNQRVYVLDYDEKNKSDLLRCLSLETGKEIWHRGYKVSLKRNHGFSRTVPSIAGKYIVTIGPKCQVMCADVETGDLYWGLDLSAEWETTVPLWYTGQCPLIYENQVFLGVGSQKALVISVDCATGKILWSIPNPNQWQMSHSSIMPFPYHQQTYFIYCSLGGCTIFSSQGKIVAELNLATTPWNPQVIAPSPLVLPEGKIWLTAGYGAGSMLVQIQENTLTDPSQDKKPSASYPFKLQVLQTLKIGEGIASEQQTPIFYQGKIFTILPKDAGEHRRQLVCCNPKDGSQFVWMSGKTQRFGLGPYLIADQKMILLDDDGTLFLLSLAETGFTWLAKHRIIKGQDAWAPLALVEGKLLFRDSETLLCVDLAFHP